MAAPMNKDGRSGCTRHGRHDEAKETEAPMHQEAANQIEAPSAIDAIRAEVRRGGYQIHVACIACGWTSRGDLLLIDRYHAGYPFEGLTRRCEDEWIDVVLDDEDTSAVFICDRCDADLLPDTVVPVAIRDRHGRCAQALANDLAVVA